MTTEPNQSHESYQFDVAALRERFDRGEADAADELIELATEQENMDELRRLAEQGNITAIEQLDALTAEGLHHAEAGDDDGVRQTQAPEPDRRRKAGVPQGLAEVRSGTGPCPWPSSRWCVPMHRSNTGT